MSIATVFSIVKLLWPSNWLKAIAVEAERSPAIISGGFVLWGTLLGLSGLFYWGHVVKAEERDMQMATLIAANQVELGCARQDRTIAAKAREISNMRLLIERTDNDIELRRLNDELSTLLRNQTSREQTYANNCLNKE